MFVQGIHVVDGFQVAGHERLKICVYRVAGLRLSRSARPQGPMVRATLRCRLLRVKACVNTERLKDPSINKRCLCK
jgi:hypothetical protein